MPGADEARGHGCAEDQERDVLAPRPVRRRAQPDDCGKKREAGDPQLSEARVEANRAQHVGRESVRPSSRHPGRDVHEPAERGQQRRTGSGERDGACCRSGGFARRHAQAKERRAEQQRDGCEMDRAREDDQRIHEASIMV